MACSCTLGWLNLEDFLLGHEDGQIAERLFKYCGFPFGIGSRLP